MTSDDFLKDPLLVQQSLLTQFEKNLDDDQTVVDTNNAFAFTMESIANLSAHIARRVDDRLVQTFPKRATDTSDLYDHISEYNYIGFYSYPSTLTLRISLDKNYVIKNAVPVTGTNFNKLVIPKDTVFDVGAYKFSLYYPIEVRVAPAVGSVTVVYDTTEQSPLKSLNSNIISNYESHVYGVTLLTFELPVYQFERTSYTESIIPNIGFKKTFTYTDKFYAIRITSAASEEDGVKAFPNDVDLALTMSDKIYDIDTPTAIFRVMPESNTVVVNIPKIYFLNKLVNTKIRIEVLTSKGELDVNISNLELEDIIATFNVPKYKSDQLQYTSILNKIPTISIQPSASRIVGGTNGMTFEEMKDAVLYSSSSAVPITATQIEHFFDTRGFMGVLRVDNITDRIYYAYKRITDKGVSLGVVNSTMTMRLNNVPFSFKETERNSKILVHGDEHIVIMPGAIFQCNKDTANTTLLTDTEVHALKTSPKSDVVSRLNDELLTIYPHHLSCIKTDNYTRARSYDLFDTGISNVIFIRENLTMSAQLTLVLGDITHLNEGVGGYRIRLGFVMTEEIKNIISQLISERIALIDDPAMTESELAVVIKEVVDATIFIEANTQTAFGTTAKFESEFYGFHDELAVFDILVNTTYNLEDNEIDISGVSFSTGITKNTRVKLTGIMNIIPTVKAKYFPTASYDSILRRKMVKRDDDYLAISHQTFEYKLGNLIDDVIDNNLFLGWEGEEFETHTADVPLFYEAPVYVTDNDGNIAYTIEDIDGTPTVVVNKVEGKDIGDPVLDDEGEQVYQYRAGDPVRTEDGTIVKKDKSLSYTVDLTTVDYRHYLTVENFFESYTELVRDYFDPVRDISQSILEETDVYLREIDTLTSARFKVNNNVEIKTSPDLNFQFKLFVSERTFKDISLMDSLKESIQAIVESHISQRIISVSFITKEIIETIGDYITAIDGISINNDPNIQTLALSDPTRVARLGYDLKLSDTNEYFLFPAIDFDIQILSA